MIYFDNAATTKPYKEVLDTYNKYCTNHFFNASSIYKEGRDNYFLSEKIKENIIQKLLLKDKKVIFTSSATEANNLAILGYLAGKENKNYNIITTNIEHKSVLSVFKYLETKGFNVTYLHVNNNHQIDIKELNDSINEKTIFGSIMGVNNETGSILNLEEVYNLFQKYNIVLHSDMSQALYKSNKSLLRFGNMITISSHKIHGLKSIAALILDKKIPLEPILRGGNQEYGIRSSTIDLPLIASFYKAIEINEKNFNNNEKIVKDLHDYFLKKCAERDYICLNLPLYGTNHIINFSFKNHIKSSVVVEALSQKEIYVSSTSACNSKSEPISYVVKNIYNDDIRAKNTIRISFDEQNTTDEIDIFFNEMDNIVQNNLWEY